jgi:hypothetical protein
MTDFLQHVSEPSRLWCKVSFRDEKSIQSGDEPQALELNLTDVSDAQ